MLEVVDMSADVPLTIVMKTNSFANRLKKEIQLYMSKESNIFVPIKYTNAMKKLSL